MQMVNRPEETAAKKFRSSSVMLDSGENSPVLEASTHLNKDGLPANVRAALRTAKELFSTTSQQNMTMLRALYM